MVTYRDIQKLALSLPETTEKLAWDSPAFYVRDKMFAAIRQDGKTLAISFPREERAIYVVTDPKTFPDLDHFKDYDYMAINMAHVKPSELEELLRMAWTFRAPARLAASHQELHG